MAEISTTAHSSTVIAPPVAQLARQLDHLLERTPELGREHHWQGQLAGSHGAATGSEMCVEARIAFHGSLIEGRGEVVNRPPSPSPWDGGFALSGTLCNEAVELRLWFSTADVGRVPFCCAGVLNVDGREMTGSWTTACFNPDSCGCDGGGGTFQLQRID